MKEPKVQPRYGLHTGSPKHAIGPLLLVTNPPEAVISLPDRPLSAWFRAGADRDRIRRRAKPHDLSPVYSAWNDSPHACPYRGRSQPTPGRIPNWER